VVGGRCAFSAKNLNRARDPPRDMPIPSPINPATGGKTRKEVGKCREIAPSSIGEGTCSGELVVWRLLLDDASAIVMSLIDNGID
jgi:hypothetical protein